MINLIIRKIFIICLIFTFCIPAYSMSYEEYQGQLLLYQAKEWQKRVANSPKRNGRYYNYYCKSKIRGIGVKLRIIDGNLTIKSVKEGFSADKKGLKEGQIITKINGISTKNRGSVINWGMKISSTPNGIPIIEVDGVEYKLFLHDVKNIDYKEIAPKVYIDIASINIKKGSVFFWLKYLNGNELIPIKDKNVYYFEDAYVVDCVNHKIATIEQSAFNKNEEIIYQDKNYKNAEIANKTGWTREILGYNPNADYSGLEYNEIVPNSAADYLEQVLMIILEESKKYDSIELFQSLLRYY